MKITVHINSILSVFLHPGFHMIEMLVRRAAGVYEKETLPGQGLGGYILKSRSSKTTTPINESGASSINGTLASSTDKYPCDPPSTKR